MFRQINFDILGRAQGKADGDLILGMAFASEEPYERWWGIEILDMGEKSIRLGRLNDRASILFNHNPNAIRGVHVPGTVKVDKDRVLRGDVQLTSATQDGRDTINLVESKVLSKASVGYIIHKVVEIGKTKKGEEIKREIDGRTFEGLIDRSLESRALNRAAFYRNLDKEVGFFDRSDDGVSEFRVMDWEPFENSLVTIPADTTVGIGRSHHHDNDVRTDRTSKAAERAKHEEGLKMTDEEKKEKEEQEARTRAAEAANAAAVVAAAGRKPDALEMEKARKQAIENICKANHLDDKYKQYWISSGISLEKVTDDLLGILEERGKTNPQPASLLGMTQNETQRFSLIRAVHACAENDWTNAPFELECSREVAKKLGKVVDTKRFLVPFEVLQRPVAIQNMERQRRDLTVASAGGGGYLVSTDNVGFIELLRNRSVVFRMGARRLSGLQGNVTVPRQSAGATAYWLATEGTQITESQQTFVQVALTPKTAGAYTEISRLLMLQSSPGAEGIVTDDLARVVALAADLAVINGAGSGGQPLGIIGTSGIGAVTGTSLGYAGVLEFQTDVAGANVVPLQGGYVTTPAVAALMMQRVKFTNTASPLWEGNIWDGQMAGFPAMSSNQIPAADMLFGDWQEVVVGEWGVLEIEVNPYANFQAGVVGIRAMYTLDCMLRRPFAFSLGTVIT